MSRIILLQGIASHLAKQRGISANGHGVCQYRAPSGNKCAIGGILPPELFSPLIESKDISTMFDYADSPKSTVDPSETAACRRVVNWLCEQMPEITDRNIAASVLFSAQRYHDDTGGHCYETELITAKNTPGMSDEVLATRIFTELKARTDALCG